MNSYGPLSIWVITLLPYTKDKSSVLREILGLAFKHWSSLMAATIRILRLHPKQLPANFVQFSSFSSSDQPSSKFSSSEEIRKKLASFRSQSGPPPPPPIGGDQLPSPLLPSKDISFRELYKQNVASKEEGFSPNAAKLATGKLSFDDIRQSIREFRKKNPGIAPGKRNDPLSLSNFKDSLRLRPDDLSPKEQPIVTGSDKLSTSMFLKENKDFKDGDNRAAVRKVYLSGYNHQELGEKLRSLRPDYRGKKNWFSFQELNDRLIKLREIDDKESESRIGGVCKYLRECLVQIRATGQEENRNSMIRKLDVLSHLGENTDYLSHPPKEHLVEKYFDPGNMSSAEKMKLELKKVRDEFKMSETDCGSARVQVAQLTTKIKHLSGVLHKKDKHSRKGLQAMVQKRKKLLKFLRRTDWDSYCLVLSKLGLRDNPDYKN